MRPRSVDVDRLLTFGDRVYDAVTKGQTVREETFQIAHKRFIRGRIYRDHPLQNHFELSVKFGRQLLNILDRLLCKQKCTLMADTRQPRIAPKNLSIYLEKRFRS